LNLTGLCGRDRLPNHLPDGKGFVRHELLRRVVVYHDPVAQPVGQWTGIGAKIRAARENKGLTWYAVTKEAEIALAV
jgi:hypothetical protein